MVSFTKFISLAGTVKEKVSSLDPMVERNFAANMLSNTRACEAECPKLVSISNIARLNREFIAAKLKD